MLLDVEHRQATRKFRRAFRHWKSMWKRVTKQAAAPMIEEIKEGDENQPKDGEEEENDISPETRAEFIERGWSSISADLDILAKEYYS